MSAWTAARHMSELRVDVTWTRDPDCFCEAFSIKLTFWNFIAVVDLGNL